MKTHRKLLLSILSVFAFYQPLIAQTENPLIDRGFWRKKPTTDLIQQKIDEGHSLSELNYHGYDALSTAILNANDLGITKLLVNNGADIHKKIIRSGRTPVFWAVYKDNFEILEYLVSQGAQIDLKDSNNNSLIMYAASSGASDRRIYDFLLKRGVKLNDSITDEQSRTALLLYAGRMKKIEMIDYFLEKGLSIHRVDEDGNGVFNYAARSKNKSFLEALIQRGASYNPSPKTGENAFTFATRGRGGELKVEFLEYLERLGLDPTAVTQQGRTCLSNISFSEKKLEIFKYFVEKGVDPNKTDNNGNTPLMRASYRNSKEIIEYLLGVSEDINFKNNDGYTALGNALRRNTPEVVEFLIKKGAKVVNVKDNKGNDLGAQLVDSYRSDDMKILNEKMQLLKQEGYQPLKASVQNGNSLLQVAIRNGNERLVKEVIDMQIPINYKNDESYTPLHVAVMTAHNEKIIKTLLEAGANKSIKTEFEESVYELALENEVLKNKNINLDFLKENN